MKYTINLARTDMTEKKKLDKKYIQIQILLGVLMGWFFSSIPNFAQERAIICDAARLTEAERLYSLGQHRNVVQLLEPCLPEEFERDSQPSAHRLVILSYYYLENEAESEKWGNSLMEMHPSYQPPTNDVPYFRFMVEALRPIPWHRKWKFRIPILGVAVGTAVYFIFRPEDPIPLKPLPPSPPDPER